jgi:predicted kinase
MELILMRGVSGSGKSTLARTLCPAAQIFSTDDLFMVDKDYRFKPAKLGEYHVENQKRVEWALQEQWPVVCVDNTNTQIWEMVPYVRLADTYGYQVKLVEADTPWRFDANVLAAINTHDVPLETIKRMIARYEHGVTVEDIRSFTKKEKMNDD